MKPVPPDIFAIQLYYPRIYHACHVSHKRGKSDQLSDRDATILAHLSEQHICSPTQLSKHLNISKATLSEALAKLMDLNLVHSEADKNDARRQWLRLTEKGKQAMSKASVLDADKLATLLQSLSDTDRKKAVDGLAILAKAAMELDP